MCWTSSAGEGEEVVDIGVRGERDGRWEVWWWVWIECKALMLVYKEYEAGGGRTGDWPKIVLQQIQWLDSGVAGLGVEAEGGACCLL